MFLGSIVHRLRGVDPDGDELFFGVKNQPGSDIIRVENFNPNEANIYLNKPLDREVKLLNFICHSIFQKSTRKIAIFTNFIFNFFYC